MCLDSISAAPEIQPGGKAGGKGAALSYPLPETGMTSGNAYPPICVQNAAGSGGKDSVIQQQFKGKKIGLNDDALEFARLHTEHVRSFLKWIDKLSESVLHMPDAGDSSPTYGNYEDVPESNKATEKMSIWWWLSGPDAAR